MSPHSRGGHVTCSGQRNVGGSDHVSIQSLGLKRPDQFPLTLRVLLLLTHSQGGPGHLRGPETSVRVPDRLAVGVSDGGHKHTNVGTVCQAALLQP